ncbi:hypothetical protein CEXT_698641 [Caerostris extrusa]|uniref:Uncharacterized protein n=1 Tax=Caerostris extrusa TaxID=172846 RepID=A0AAV4MGR4_CAEEX|nr:hypothetical protein CEXT_698641 [Caerostris extrusa]
MSQLRSLRTETRSSSTAGSSAVLNKQNDEREPGSSTTGGGNYFATKCKSLFDTMMALDDKYVEPCFLLYETTLKKVSGVVCKTIAASINKSKDYVLPHFPLTVTERNVKLFLTRAIAFILLERIYSITADSPPAAQISYFGCTMLMYACFLLLMLHSEVKSFNFGPRT